MAPLVGIQAHFYLLLLCFQGVMQPLIHGLLTMLLLSTRLTLPIFNLTLHTNPLSSQYVSTTLQICQSFLMVFASSKISMSPTLQVPFMFVHFFLSWSDCNSFLQRDTRIHSPCAVTRLYLLQLYKSGLEKSPRNGKIIFEFMVKIFDGDRASCWSDH